MMFQFLSGRRPLNASPASDIADAVELPWSGQRSDDRGSGIQDAVQHAGLDRDVSTFPSPEGCSVERACTSFLEAHDNLVASTEGDAESGRELFETRDQAFQQVRLFPGLTREAVKQKKRVLDAVCEWFSFDDPRVGAFAFEVASEAVALLHVDAGQMCSCHDTHDTARLVQARVAERRNPLSWFGRSRSQTTDAPFAN